MIYHKSNENTDQTKTRRAAAVVHNTKVLFLQLYNMA